MRLRKGVHTSTANHIPQFDGSVCATAGIHFCRQPVLDTGDTRSVLLRRNGADEALRCVDVVDSQHFMIGADYHEIARRME